MVFQPGLHSQIVTIEDFIFLTMGAVGAAQAAEKQNCDARSDDGGEDACAGCEPVKYSVHNRGPHSNISNASRAHYGSVAHPVRRARSGGASLTSAE